MADREKGVQTAVDGGVHSLGKICKTSTGTSKWTIVSKLNVLVF